jgi:hypothetical protein
VMVRPAISRGTGLPGSVRPFTVTEASWHSIDASPLPIW